MIQHKGSALALEPIIPDFG